jgi:hypothetical protein
MLLLCVNLAMLRYVHMAAMSASLQISSRGGGYLLITSCSNDRNSSSDVEENPTYGKYVRELKWTVFDVKSHTWRWYLEDEEENRVPGYDLEDPEVYEPEDGKSYALSHESKMLTISQNLYGGLSNPSPTLLASINAASGTPLYSPPIPC